MMIIWAFCNRKGGNCREKPILHLYAKYDSWAEICPEIVLTQKKIFPAVSPLFIAKGPYSQIQTIIDHFIEKPNMEFTNNLEGQIQDIDSEEEISDDQTNVAEVQANPLVS